MGTALFPADFLDEKLGGLHPQLFVRLVADDRAFRPAQRTLAIIGLAGNRNHASFQVLRQWLAPGVGLTRDFGCGQRDGLFRLWPVGFLLDFRHGETRLFPEQGRLGGRKLFTLGAKEPQVKEPNFLLPEFNDPRPARQLRLLIQNVLANVVREFFERNHLIRFTYLID